MFLKLDYSRSTSVGKSHFASWLGWTKTWDKGRWGFSGPVIGWYKKYCSLIGRNDHPQLPHFKRTPRIFLTLILGMYWAGVIFFLKLFHALVMLKAIDSKLSVDVFGCRLTNRGISWISSLFFVGGEAISFGISHLLAYFRRISSKFIKKRLSRFLGLLTFTEITPNGVSSHQAYRLRYLTCVICSTYS